MNTRQKQNKLYKISLELTINGYFFNATTKRKFPHNLHESF